MMLCVRYVAGSSFVVCMWFAGLFCDPSGFDISQKIIRRRSSGQLKRLGFVRTYGIYCWARANKLMASVYSNGRSCLPGMLDSSFRNFEHKVTDVTLPIISAMQAKSIGVLAKLDNQVSHSFAIPGPFPVIFVECVP